jgi:cytochrome P450
MLDEMTGAGFQIEHGLLAAFRNRGRGNAIESRSAQPLIRSLDEALRAEIARRRAAADFEEREDILSALMSARDSAGMALGDRRLRDELVTLLVAGHESTATMLAWAFERLVRHPDKLDCLRAEIAAGGHTYADAVVKETLRLRPVLPIVLRELAMPMRLDGYELPAGTWLAPCAYLVNRDPEIYPAPRQFRPERFLEKPPGPYSWTPFGGGVRRCVGAAFAQLEMRVVLQTVFSRLDLRAPDTTPERIGRRFITLAPARGGRVVLVAKLPERAHHTAADECPAVDHHEEQQLARQRDDRRAEHEHSQAHQN